MAPDPRPPSKLKRLTDAALNADSTLGRVDALTTGLASLMEELSGVTGRLEPTLVRVDVILDELDHELSALSETRASVDRLLEKAERILGLVEWMLAPAFVARVQLERGVAYAHRLRDSVLRLEAVHRHDSPARERPAS